jgi:polyisoprenyl-phosphate glycosyltransferase
MPHASCRFPYVMVCRLQPQARPPVKSSRGVRLATTAIIAAYNEEKTIADVLTALSSSALIDEIIVVSDGSTDDTVAIARRFDGVTTIALKENRGKGYAMRVGVDWASNDVLFFVDGDMFNVTQQHIAALVLPVLSGECDMNIGVRHRGEILNFMHLNLKCGPVLSGIRVMRRRVFETVPQQYQERFKIEAALNCFCAKAGFTQQQTIIHNLGHLIKESKRGLLSGLIGRWDMIREVSLLLFDLYLFETWRWSTPREVPVAEFDLFE